MSPESTDFLYPFIEGGEVEAGVLLGDLAASARAQAAESARLLDETTAALAQQIERVAAQVDERLRSGGRIFTMGNGGSSTDADAFAQLLTSPPSGRAVAARSLAADPAVLTALGNDVGYELVFSRQVIAYGRRGDVLVGFSTSGNSVNLMRAFAEGRARGLLTVGLAGYEGGEMAASADVEHCLVVRSDSVHRIQETQAGIALLLWRSLQERLDSEVT